MQITQLFSQRHKYFPLFFLLWVGFVSLIYFLWFPLPQPNADNPYPAFGLALWITWVAITSGATILRYFKIHYRSQAEHLVFSAAIGFALIAYLVLGLGLLHLLYSWIAYSFLILLTLLSSRQIRPTIKTFRYYLERAYTASSLDVLLGAMIFFLLLYHFLGTLVPIIFFDSLVYHTAMPKLYVLNHAIVYCPYNFYSNFPFTLEMLYTLGLLLQGSILVKCLNYLIHIIMLAGLYSFTRTYFSHRSALISVAVFYTIPWVSMTSFLLYIDIGLGCYFWLAMYALINWVVRKETGWIYVCGVLTGVMLGIKYLAAYDALILGLSVVGFVIWHYFSPKTEQAHLGSTRPSLWQCFRPVWQFAIPAFLIGSPWYIKNLLWTGNPIYPFLFGGREWDLARLQSYMDKFHSQIGSVHGDFWSFLRLPWDLVFHYDVPIGPTLLVFVPLLLFVKRVPPLIKYLLGASLAFFILWANGSQQSRFLIPIFPFLSVAAGYGIAEGSSSETGWHKKIGYIVLYILLLSNVCWSLIYVQSTFSPFKVIAGLESTSDYLSQQLPTLYPITQYANETLPPDAQILYIGETRGYYADRVFIANTAHDETPIVKLTHQARDVDDLVAKLRALGITHIIFNKREGTRLQTQYKYLQWHTAEDEKRFWTFYQTRLKLLQTINDSELLEIVATDKRG